MNEIYGLFSVKTGPVPLQGVKVDGDILGHGAKVKISQRFKNMERKAIEAVYKFPLPEDAAIYGLRAVIDGKRIQGQVEESEKAFERYDKALMKGDRASILDQERPNIFTLSVGNLNPGAEVTIEIEYAVLLGMEGQEVRFFLPTTISPRYIPDGMDARDGISESSRLHPAYAEDVPYGLSLSLNIHNGGLLKSIDSPSHSIKVDNLKGEPVNITFSAQSAAMDRDFILNMEYEEHFTSRAYWYQSGQEGFIQLDLMLEATQTESAGLNRGAGKEIIFLLDCSGSMQGDSIREAKKALEICLKGLDSASAFTIYRFGSNYEYLFEKPEKYSGASLEKGLDYLKRIDADLGGTEIFEPLKDIFAIHHDKRGVERDIVLLTDGEVGNEEQIFKLVRKYQESTRLFSIGIGAGCNEYFIKGLARAGRGASEFVYPGERIEPKALRLFSKIKNKSLENPVISWGKDVEQAPVDPVIFFGSPVTLFARYKGTNLPTEKITVKGHVDGQDRKWEIDITESHNENIPLPILWARERIRDLEETRSDLDERGSRQKGRKTDRWKEAILEISKKYNILSQSTSYLAIEEREEKDKTTGELVLRKIPGLVTKGWHGRASISGRRQGYARRVMFSMDLGEPLVSESRVVSEMSADRYDGKMVFLKEQTTLKFPSEYKTDIVLAILSLQRAEGGMALNEEVSRMLGINFMEIMECSRRITIETELERIRYFYDRSIDGFVILSTAILLQTLEIYFQSERGDWGSVTGKSEGWLMHVIHEGRLRIEGRDLMSWAQGFVRNNVNVRV